MIDAKGHADDRNVARIPQDLSRVAKIVAAYVSNNHIQSSDLPGLIQAIHTALVALGQNVVPASSAVEKPTLAQIRKSITHDVLISFEDGRGYKTLKRHLTAVGFTPEAYREKWGLPSDYPMTAPGYSERRSKLAIEIGLGQVRRNVEAPASQDAAADEAVAEPPKGRGRSKKGA